jgi:predicted nucleic acid-binding protein
MKVLVDSNLLVYLNVPMPEEQARLVEAFWRSLLEEHSLYANLLVLDEVVYISRRKYGVSLEDTLEFLDRAVLPFVEVLPPGSRPLPLLQALRSQLQPEALGRDPRGHCEEVRPRRDR